MSRNVEIRLKYHYTVGNNWRPTSSKGRINTRNVTKWSYKRHQINFLEFISMNLKKIIQFSRENAYEENTSTHYYTSTVILPNTQ